MPVAFRDTFTLYPVRAGGNAGADALSRWQDSHDAAPPPRRSRSFSDPLKRVGGERQKNHNRGPSVARNTMQFRGESLADPFSPPASLGETLPLDRRYGTTISSFPRKLLSYSVIIRIVILCDDTNLGFTHVIVR